MVRYTHLFIVVSNLWVNVLHGGSFDCSVIYDEFDNLMNKQFLIDAGSYVPTITDRLTREEFSVLQKNKLRLREERKEMGVAIVQTNKRTRGKIVFSWDGLPVDGYPPLVLEETIIYGRVADGYAPRQLRPILVKPGFSVDLDSGEVSVEVDSDSVNQAEEDADLVYSVEGEQLAIEAINGASLEFPIESMCKPAN